MIRRLVLAIVSSAFCIGIKAQTPDEVISQFKSLQVFSVENRIAGISYPDGCPLPLRGVPSGDRGRGSGPAGTVRHTKKERCLKHLSEERKTGLGPATSTLARLRSTN